MPKRNTRSPRVKIIAPAPVLYVAAFVAGLALHYFFRLPVLPFKYALTIGVVLMFIGIATMITAISDMMNAGAVIDLRKPATSLLTKGIFRVSRNPIYLSLTLFFSGIALALNSLALLIFVVIATITTLFGVIMPEESYMRKTFGMDYVRYRKRVRRWF